MNAVLNAVHFLWTIAGTAFIIQQGTRTGTGTRKFDELEREREEKFVERINELITMFGGTIFENMIFCGVKFLKSKNFAANSLISRNIWHKDLEILYCERGCERPLMAAERDQERPFTPKKLSTNGN